MSVLMQNICERMYWHMLFLFLFLGELPMFPRSLLPKVWGVCHIAVEDYIEFNEHNCLVIGMSLSAQDWQSTFLIMKIYLKH